MDHVQSRKPRFDPWAGKIPWRREWQPTLVFLPEKSHRQRSLAGYSPGGSKRIRYASVETSHMLNETVGPLPRAQVHRDPS